MTPDDLKTHLDALDWSQAELARRVGVAPNTVYRWAAGLSPIPAWLEGYLDMAVTLCRCVTGQAVITVNDLRGLPLAVYELADRMGIPYLAKFKERQREYEERMRRDALREWQRRD